MAVPPLPHDSPIKSDSSPHAQAMAENAGPELSSAAPKRGTLILLAALLIGYAGLSHYSNSDPNAKGLGAALSLGPVILIAVLLAWRWAPPLLAVLVTAAVSALLYYFWPFFERNYEWADLVQQGAVYGLVALSFARSLFAGRVPVCMLLALRLHGALGPEELAYMRRATLAWTIFYVLIAAAVVTLFFVTSPRIWSIFVNFAVFGLIALMCLADFAVRRQVLPRRPGGGIVAALRQSLIG